MYKYNFLIDGEPYEALFTDHFEADDFITANESDGAVVVVNGYKEMKIIDILNDNDFEYYYKIEMVSLMLYGADFCKGKKTCELESCLQSINLI